jgi:hypothetical protein
MKGGITPLILNLVLMPQRLYPKHVHSHSPASSCLRKVTILKAWSEGGRPVSSLATSVSEAQYLRILPRMSRHDYIQPLYDDASSQSTRTWRQDITSSSPLFPNQITYFSLSSGVQRRGQGNCRAAATTTPRPQN